MQRTYACGPCFSELPLPKWLEDVHTETSGATNHGWKTSPSPSSASSSAREGKENGACRGFGSGAYVTAEI